MANTRTFLKKERGNSPLGTTDAALATWEICSVPYGIEQILVRLFIAGGRRVKNTTVVLRLSIKVAWKNSDYSSKTGH